MATHGDIPLEPVPLPTEEDYESIANSFFSLSQQCYRIYNGWYRAPGIYGVVSETVGNLCLLLRRTSDGIYREGQDPASLLSKQLQANVDNLNQTITNIESTLNTLTDLVNKYQSDRSNSWDRLVYDAADDREFVNKALLDILFYISSLDIWWLSISDGRYLDLNTRLDSIYTDESENSRSQYILHGLQNEAHLEEGWQQLALRLTRASYDADAVANARAEIVSYMKFKILRSPRPLVSPSPWINISNSPSIVEPQSNFFSPKLFSGVPKYSDHVKPPWMTIIVFWLRLFQLMILIILVALAGVVLKHTNGGLDYEGKLNHRSIVGLLVISILFTVISLVSRVINKWNVLIPLLDIIITVALVVIWITSVSADPNDDGSDNPTFLGSDEDCEGDGLCIPDLGAGFVAFVFIYESMNGLLILLWIFSLVPSIVPWGQSLMEPRGRVEELEDNTG